MLTGVTHELPAQFQACLCRWRERGPWLCFWEPSPGGISARSEGMSLEALAPGLTFALACVSATVFLLLRCEGKGRRFGPRSRGWAVLVIGLTGALSAGLAETVALLG